MTLQDEINPINNLFFSKMWFGRSEFPQWSEPTLLKVASIQHSFISNKLRKVFDVSNRLGLLPPRRSRTNWLTTMMHLTIQNWISVYCHWGRGGGSGRRGSSLKLHRELEVDKARAALSSFFKSSRIYIRVAFSKVSALKPFSKICVFRPRKCSCDVNERPKRNKTSVFAKTLFLLYPSGRHLGIKSVCFLLLTPITWGLRDKLLCNFSGSTGTYPQAEKERVRDRQRERELWERERAVRERESF